MTTTMWFTTIILLLLILLVISALAIDSLGTATKSFDQHADEALQLFVTQPVEKPDESLKVADFKGVEASVLEYLLLQTVEEPGTFEEAARNLFLNGLITYEEYHRVVCKELN